MWRVALGVVLASTLGCTRGGPTGSSMSGFDISHATVADVPDLIEVFRERENLARRHAAFRAMVSIGKPAVPALTEGLKDGDPLIRADCAAALGEIGRDASDAVPALTMALDDSSREVASAVSIAMRKIDPGSANQAAD